MKLPTPNEIKERFLRCGFSLNDDQAEKFHLYLRELLRWNRVHNLTAIREPRKIITFHFIDSITPHLLMKKLGIDREEIDIADVGSGGGFPGIPLKIYLPHIELTMIESNHKKCAFLEEAGVLLGMRWKVICKRAEEVKQKYTLVITRALDDLEKRVEDLEKLSEGFLFIMKEKNYDREWCEKHHLKAFPVSIPGIGERNILWKEVIPPSR